MVITVALAVCVGTPVFAASSSSLKSKENTITISLTAEAQTSVSTTKQPNQGTWSQGPKYYKTSKKKLTQKEIIKAIGAVTGRSYSSKASLVLVQAELSGFFNITPDLADATQYEDGTYDVSDPDDSTALANSLNSTYVRLATGRHFEVNPENDFFPTGHMQPWGQIYIKDPVGELCENVTYFFNISIEECYDCFYMNSFISDATFQAKDTSVINQGPPCCTIPSSSVLVGKGRDRYYMTLTFDNTPSNPYLNPRVEDLYVGYPGIGWDEGNPEQIDGITPDFFEYVDSITSLLGPPRPNLMRFTLNGIVDYNWNLNFVNKTDLWPDFVGKAKYDANGYGFIGLYCSLLNGSMNFSEKLVKIDTCCLDEPWYDEEWYGNFWNVWKTTGWYNDDTEQSPHNPDAAISWHGPSYYNWYQVE